MKAKCFMMILVLLMLFLPVSYAKAGGVVEICDEAHLLEALSGGGLVTFTCSGTIALTSTIAIAIDTTVDGNSQAVKISGNSVVQVFIVNSGITLSLNEMTIANGNSASSGGGIINYGILNVSNSSFSGNSAPWGGGVINFGTATISNSTFTSNSAGNGGGGIANDSGTLNVINGTFISNNASSGGGIYVYSGTATISNSTFTSNSAGNGGGIYVRTGITHVSNSTFSGNSVGSSGGGVANDSGELIVSNSILTSNSAIIGGGISNYSGGTSHVSNSTFSSNSASWGGGFINLGIATVSSSTFLGNNVSSGGGGIANDPGSGTITVSNSTFSSNSAGSFGGGGIYIHTGTAIVINSTLSGNSAPAGLGGGIRNNNGTLNLGNSIITNSLLGNNCAGTIVDHGGNLSYPDSTCPGINSDPLLGPLQDNGGSTYTMALGVGSLAIDTGSSALCAASPMNNLDQRGVTRPIDGNGDGVAICDIGSFEYQPVPTMTTIIGDSPDPSQAGEPFSVTFGVTSSLGVPTGVVTITVSGSPASCHATLTVGSGSCELTLDSLGSYMLTAQYGGSSSFAPSSDTEEHSVMAVPTVTTISGDIPDPSWVGEPFTVTYAVTSSIGIPTGVITVTVINSAESCNSTLSNGIGSCDLTLDKPGIYTLAAHYGGAGSFSPSSHTEVHTIIAPTVTKITGDAPNPSQPGDTFIVNLSVASAFGIPSGTVTVTVSNSPASCHATLTAGSGSCELTLDTLGNYTLTAQYGGSSGFAPSSDTEEHSVVAGTRWLYLPLVLKD